MPCSPPWSRLPAAASASARLVDEVWGADQPPANPAKALQVVVSRTRAQTAPEVVERAAGGYRLGLDPMTVDVLALRHEVSEATAAEAPWRPDRRPRLRPPCAGRRPTGIRR